MDESAAAGALIKRFFCCVMIGTRSRIMRKVLEKKLSDADSAKVAAILAETGGHSARVRTAAAWEGIEREGRGLATPHLFAYLLCNCSNHHARGYKGT